MEFEITTTELRKRKLFIATPMYGGMCHGSYTKSCLELKSVCQHYGIENKFFYLFNESLITRARNYCVDEFLRTGDTHLLFIDSDIGFDAGDAITMLAMMDHTNSENDKEIMCAPYPKKTIAWEKIKEAVQSGFADKNPNELDRFVGDFVFNPKENAEDILISEPTKVLEGGTGFMMIARSAFEKFKDAYPENSYYPDHIRTKNFDGESEIHMYFQALLSTEDDGKKRYLSEDYMFCQWMDKAGVDTWMCPWMKLNHTGAMMFGGSLSDIAELGVAPTADSSKIVKK